MRELSRESFTFLDLGRLIDNDLELVLDKTCPADPEKELAPEYRFKMAHAQTGERMGVVSLRIGDMDKLVKYGHIGYGVMPEHRGRHLAAGSCRLLFPLAGRHGLTTLWITCDPENTASRRTCEIAGGRLVEIVDLPEDNDRCMKGKRKKCRYRFDL